MRVVTRLAFSGSPSAADLPAVVEAALDASRLAVLGAEGVAAGGLLDGVLLHVADYSDGPALRALLVAAARCVAPPGWSAEAAGGRADAPQPKVAALGLVDPPPEAITAAVSARVCGGGARRAAA